MAHQLEEAEYLRSNLLADVAHELRNPLHVLRGNLQAMLDDVYPLNKREIARLVDQTHHLTALVDDLHELAQAEAHQLPLYMEATDIAALLKETTAIFEPMARAKGVSVRVELLGTMPVLAVDPDRMQQVLSNLLANALRFTPKGGAITVTAEQQAGAFCICVRDTGVGIAVEDLPRVFDRFYQADPARNRETASSGLGLAIAKAIVVEHGGRIAAESAGPGQGSRFTIELPLKG
jgi:signal transduction histidine kinase